MNNILNKEFEYRGYKFNIKLELNTRIERGFNGGRYHTITVRDENDMGFGSYYKKDEINDKLR